MIEGVALRDARLPFFYGSFSVRNGCNACYFKRSAVSFELDA